MTARDTVAEAVVTGVGTVAAPAGTGLDEPWFDYRARLGPRGYKYLPDACQYLLAAAKDALTRSGAESAGPAGSGRTSGPAGSAGSAGSVGSAGAAGDGPAALAGCAEERRAAVVGTNSAVAALHADITEVVRAGGINRLSPMLTPFFSVNLVASRLSTEHRLKGFNTTVTSPRVAGLEALHVAARELGAGRGDLVLAGVTEAFDPGHGTAAAEAGSVVLVLRPPADAVRPGGALLRTTLRFVPPAALAHESGRRRAGREVREALEALAAPGRAPELIRVVTDGSAVAAAVEAAVRDWSARRVPLSVEAVGARAGALAPMERVAHDLRDGAAGPRTVVAVAGEGNVAFASVDPYGTA
ncbi:beta-ketoacyl synthase N-terminal-like domain-containing protein [Streptomyces ardesiacus]|uniref:beta-ketoacyl synthase N-terminal-like domain-containing protein n=1 Tax=Streptomyces ardesiacus TaxID=285564 RepID=UPI0036E7EC06